MDSTLASLTATRRPAPPLATVAARAAPTAASAGGNGATTGAVGTAGTQGSADTDDGFGFLDVLSMLNPLQYLPVVGSIYRAVTGDTIPEGVREIGSLAISAVTGGPIGVAVSAAVSAVERLVGFDPDKAAVKVLSSLGIISDDAPQLAAAETVAQRAGPIDTRFGPWSRAQRAAYRTAGYRPTITAPARSADIPAPAGVSTASEAAMRQAASAAYTRRTLSQIESVIRERHLGRSV